jgi:hypothetical protein
LGYFTYTGDKGYYGSITKAAVGRLQFARGIITSSLDPIYGRFESRTRAAIGCGTIPPPPPPPAVSCITITHDLTLGSTDATTDGEVTRLQNYLHSRGYYAVESTLGVTFADTPGYYGPYTVIAVVQYQAAHNIAPTNGGQVTGVTRAAIACSTTSLPSPTVSMAGTATLNGSSQYVPLSRLPDSTTFTVSAWTRYTGSSCGVILSDSDRFAGNDLILGINSSHIFIRADKNGAGTSSSVPINAFGAAGCVASYDRSAGESLSGDWHHIVWVNKSEQFLQYSFLYVDGALVQAIRVSGSNVGNHASVAQVGRMFDETSGSYPSGISYFQGDIGDVRYYASALSGSQVSELYTAGRQYSNVTITPTRDPQVPEPNATLTINQNSLIWYHGFPTITGTASGASTVRVTITSQATGNVPYSNAAVPVTGGEWRLTIPTASRLAHGLYTITVVAAGIARTGDLSILPWNSPRTQYSGTPCGELPVNTFTIANQVISSCNGTYTLAVQSSDGNVVLKRAGVPFWSTGTIDTTANRGTRLIMQDDGNLVLYDNNGVSRWGSSGHGGTIGTSGHLSVQDDGNLVIRSNATGAVLWTIYARIASPVSPITAGAGGQAFPTFSGTAGGLSSFTLYVCDGLQSVCDGHNFRASIPVSVISGTWSHVYAAGLPIGMYTLQTYATPGGASLDKKYLTVQ